MSLISGVKLFLRWIQALFKVCPKRYKHKIQNDVFIVCGHRGSPTREPENTLPSFDQAMNEGVNAVETDLCITKDNVVILWHDWNPNDTVSLLRENGLEPDVKYKPFYPDIFNENRRPINKLTLREFLDNYDYIEKGCSLPVKAHIPTLKEFFEWTKNQNNLQFVFFDLKVPSSEQSFALEMMKEVRSLYESFNSNFKLIIETYDENILLPLKMMFPDFIYSLDSELHPGIILLPRKYSAVNKALKYDNKAAVIIRPRIITIANWVTYRRVVRYDVRRRERINRKFNEKKIDKLIGGTINDESEMDCLIRLGISGIQTDYNEKLIEVVKKYKLKTNSD